MPATRPVPTDRPQRNRALFVLEARRLLASGSPKQAAEICKRGLIHFPDNPTGYVILAQAYIRMGEKDRALNVLRDGYRRSGAERLEKLRATLAGERPLREAAATPAPEPVVTESPESESAATEPADTEPLIAEPATIELTGVEAAAIEPAAIGPAVAEPPVVEPPVAQPATPELVVDEPAGIEIPVEDFPAEEDVEIEEIPGSLLHEPVEAEELPGSLMHETAGDIPQGDLPENAPPGSNIESESTPVEDEESAAGTTAQEAEEPPVAETPPSEEPSQQDLADELSPLEETLPAPEAPVAAETPEQEIVEESAPELPLQAGEEPATEEWTWQPEEAVFNPIELQPELSPADEAPPEDATPVEEAAPDALPPADEVPEPVSEISSISDLPTASEPFLSGEHGDSETTIEDDGLLPFTGAVPVAEPPSGQTAEADTEQPESGEAEAEPSISIPADPAAIADDASESVPVTVMEAPETPEETSELPGSIPHLEAGPVPAAEAEEIAEPAAEENVVEAPPAMEIAATQTVANETMAANGTVATESPVTETSVTETATTESTAAPELPSMEAPAAPPQMERSGPALRMMEPRRATEGRGDDLRSSMGAERPRTLALHTGKSISRLRSSNLRLIPGLEFAPLRHEDALRRQSIAPLISEPMPQPEVPGRREKVIEDASFPPLPPLEQSPPAGERPSVVPQTVHPEMAHPEMVHPEMAHTETVYPETAEPEPEPMPAETPKPQLSIAMMGAQLQQAAKGKEPEELTPLEELARRLENARIPVVEEQEQRPAYEPTLVSETLANILLSQGAYAEALKAFQTLARVKPERLPYFQEKIAEIKWRIRNPEGTWPPEEETSGEQE